MKNSCARILALVFFLALPAFAGEPLPQDEFTIAAVGDLLLGARTEPFLKEFGPAYPFTDVKPFLDKADLVVGNLEAPISLRGKALEKKTFTLRAGPIAVEALKQGNIRVVTLANNHILDFGPLALQDTLTILSENGILHSGAGMDLDDARAPALLKLKGKTIAFLSYSLTFPLEFYASAKRPGTAPGYTEFVKADIEKIRPSADLVVVSFHWGAELMAAAKDYQIELGHQAVDWGADLVLGHHPHILQEIEVYKGRMIAYSLGNFVFGSESDKVSTSMILLLTFRGKALVHAEAIPLDINNYRVKYKPRPLAGREAAAALESINAVSARFNTRMEIASDRGTVLLSQPEPAIVSAPGSSLPVSSSPGAR